MLHDKHGAEYVRRIGSNLDTSFLEFASVERETIVIDVTYYRVGDLGREDLSVKQVQIELPECDRHALCIATRRSPAVMPLNTRRF
jgi:hypothetical protein